MLGALKAIGVARLLRLDGGAWRPLEPRERILAGILALGLLAALLVARYGLSPDARGLGTHEQLHLAPCRMISLFNIPCPFCGMTTACSLMAHGRPQQAFLCQPFGAVSFVGGVLACIVSAVAALWGRWPRVLTSPPLMAVIAASTSLALILAWVYKIIAFTLLSMAGP